MKILVTGGAGFIGSHIVDAYIEEGNEVTVIDNLQTGRKENINPKAQFHLMDIRSLDLKGFLDREKFDVVNHHAAHISVPDSVTQPLFDADVNIMGSLNLLEGASKSGVGKFIFASSGGALYWEDGEYPSSERAQVQLRSPYAVSKRTFEDFIKYYSNQMGMKNVIFRYSNIYGPRQYPDGETAVVAIFVDRLISGEPCTLNQYSDVSEGMIRDYCFVLDVVRANLLALKSGREGIFNIGTGIETNTLRLYRLIFDTLSDIWPLSWVGSRILLNGQARPGDVRKSCLKTNKAEKELGFKAEVSLQEGIYRTLKWRLGSK